ncbi:hypothetical protein KKC17_04235 [Patescibacteria group bacterium]|nr:hypothetical protein [Patescibacteria group bacterium]
MKLKYYLIWMSLGTLVSWGAFLLVINYLNPEVAGTMGLVFFYLALFLSLVGSLTLLGFTWRYFRRQDEVLFRQISVSFRQAVWLSVIVIISLFLQVNGLLTWWNLLLLILTLSLLEFLALTGRRSTVSD